MKYKTIFNMTGLFVCIFSFSMIFPIIISLIYQDGGGIIFIKSFCMSFMFGLLLWYFTQTSKKELAHKEGFLIVACFWFILGAVGALPLFLSDIPNMTLENAFFESFASLTTTGASIINDIDILPKSFIFYRFILQWLGGMGIIILAVAILPILGVGGMKMYKRETPGPVKDNKVTPKIAQTAKFLWYIYLLLTILCSTAYYFAGMSLFDAIGHAFSTVSIGGFSSYNDSIGHFDNWIINYICLFFIILSAINFNLHYVAFINKNFSLKDYFFDTEFRVFFFFQLSLILVCFLLLLCYQKSAMNIDALNHIIFQSISISLTAGFSSGSFEDYPILISLILLLSTCIGGCAGSTGGGIKVIRFILLCKQALVEMRKLITPKAIFIVKLNNQFVSEDILHSVLFFFISYIFIAILSIFLLIGIGLDPKDALFSTLACINNVASGLSAISVNYAQLNEMAKWVLIFIMVCGRLEIFTLLVLFMPRFWKNE